MYCGGYHSQIKVLGNSLQRGLVDFEHFKIVGYAMVICLRIVTDIFLVCSESYF